METISEKNRQIIGETYKKVRQEVFSIFRQACIDADTCEDLVHDVFLKIMTLDIIIEDQLKGMVMTMAYRKRIDYLRHRECMDRVHESLYTEVEPSYTNTEAEVNDILRLEQHAIDRMSDKDSRIYCMVRFEDKTADEIMLETGLTKRAVESCIYRTRNKVRSTVRQAIGF